MPGIQKNIGQPNPTPEKKLRYASNEAVLIHTLLFSYIHDQISLDHVRNKIKNIYENQPDVLARCSQEGHSVINDILHLPFAVLSDQKAALQKANELLQAIINILTSSQDLMMGNPENKKILNFLLLSSPKTNTYHPLNQVLLRKDRKLLSIYLHGLSLGLRYGCIPKTAIETLFKTPIACSGKTALHLATEADDPLILEDLINFLRRTFKEEAYCKTLLSDLLSIFSLNLQQPRCGIHLEHHQEVNDYLDQLRQGNLEATIFTGQAIPSTENKKCDPDGWEIISYGAKKKNTIEPAIITTSICSSQSTDTHSFESHEQTSQDSPSKPDKVNTSKKATSPFTQEPKCKTKKSSRSKPNDIKSPQKKIMSRNDDDIDRILSEINSNAKPDTKEKEVDCCTYLINTFFGLFNSKKTPANESHMVSKQNKIKKL